MIIPSFQSQFLVLQLVKWWLTVENFLLIVVSKYLTIVKQCLTIVLFQKLCVLRSLLVEAKTSIKPLKK